MHLTITWSSSPWWHKASGHKPARWKGSLLQFSTSSADLIAYMHRTEKARSIPRSLDPTSTLFCDHFQPWKSRVEAVSSADSADFLCRVAACKGKWHTTLCPMGAHCTLHGSVFQPMDHQKLSQKSATLFSFVLQDLDSPKLPMFHPPYFPGQSLHVYVPWNAK